MFCYVKQPNSIVMEIQFGAHDTGQVVLDKVCQQLGIIEIDYFGLMYEGAHGERLWLNTRNSICRQIAAKPPYRFDLCVKFYVQPHLILQTKTRHQFYLSIQKDFKSGVYMATAEDSEIADAIALMVQVDHGNVAKDVPLKSIYESYCPPHVEMTESLHKLILDAHRKLQGTDVTSCEYRVLDTFSLLDNYGKFHHQVVDCHGGTSQVDVGPEGIDIQSKDGSISERINYPTIHMITHSGKCVYLTLLDDSGETTRRDYMLLSKKAASGLYRCITEMHSFYRCDTVRNAVSSQYSRDLKGTLASIFSENTSMGKNYLFDIRRTCREVYDHASRVLHATGATEHHWSAQTREDEEKEIENFEILKAKLEKYQDAMLCRVCMDAKLEVAFFPCGHLVCCEDCAVHVKQCPLCRTDIDDYKQVYMPL